LRPRIAKEVWILVIALAVVAALLLFALLASLVAHGRTQAIDELVLAGLRRADDPSVPVGPRWLESVALDLTALGSASVLVVVVALVLGYQAITRHGRLLVLTLVASVGGALLSVVLKELFGRDRPTVVPHLAHVTSPSFPSGHSMLSAVVYLTLGVMLARTTDVWRVRIYLVSTALALSVLVGLTRLYLGVHYPTDVLAGWLAGFAWAVGCALAARALERRGPATSGADANVP
jgi:undecaprenyl-diphosphatase